MRVLWLPNRNIKLIAILALCIIFSLVGYWNFPTVDVAEPAPIVLWWAHNNPFPYGETRICGRHKCNFTNNRELLPQAKAVLFHGPQLRYDDWPLPRQPHHIWGLLHDEPPQIVPFLLFENLLQNFNFTSTFSRYSDFPLATQHLVGLKQLTSKKYLVPIEQKSKLRLFLAPIAFVQTDCSCTTSGRNEYVLELMKYIQIDTYGTCLHNPNMPTELNYDYVKSLRSSDVNNFLGRYKFILSYENAVCEDYMTDQFWRPLIIGSIPIIFGLPTVREWEPNPKSGIYISDFDSPASLAKFLNQLDNNDTEYNTYLKHKYEKRWSITNNFLIHQLEIRYYSKAAHQNIFRSFECALCDGMLELSDDSIQMASKDHYNCIVPMQVAVMTNKLREWESVFEVARLEAKVLDEILNLKENYTHELFSDLLSPLLKQDRKLLLEKIYKYKIYRR